MAVAGMVLALPALVMAWSLVVLQAAARAMRSRGGPPVAALSWVTAAVWAWFLAWLGWWGASRLLAGGPPGHTGAAWPAPGVTLAAFGTYAALLTGLALRAARALGGLAPGREAQEPAPAARAATAQGLAPSHVLPLVVPSRLGLLAQRRAVVTLDVGPAAVKVAQAVRHGQGVAVVAAAWWPLPRGAYRRGQLEDPVGLGRELRGLLRQLGVSSRRAVAAVGGEASFLRTVPFPRMTDAELREALRWEVDKYFPLRYEEAVVDFCVVDLTVRQLWPPGRAPEGQVPVVLGACPRRVAESMAALAEAAGLELVELEPHPLAVFRAVAHACGPQGAAGVVALLELGREAGYLSVFRHGCPVLHRSLSYSVAASDPGGADAPPGPTVDELAPVVREVRRSLEAAAMQLRARRLRVLLTGDAMADAGVASWLQESLVEALGPLVAGDPGAAVLPFLPGGEGTCRIALPDPLVPVAGAWAGTLGLALRGLGVPVARPPVVADAPDDGERRDAEAGARGP